MKPLRAAWKGKTSLVRPNNDDEGDVLPWLGHAVLPYFAGPGGKDIAALYTRDGTLVRTIAAPAPHTRQRIPVDAVVVWPEESLVIGVQNDKNLELVWVELEGASSVVGFDIPPIANRYLAQFELASTTDGAVLVSSIVGDTVREPDELWTMDRALDKIYADVLRWPFADHAYVTTCVTRTGERRWVASGRAACVADDVVVSEDVSEIVGRRAHDGEEIWRRRGRDRFVLGTFPMPAWSDDRVFVLDRHARRREAWAREATVARLHDIDLRSPYRTMASTRLLARSKRAQPLQAPSTLCCVSTRTGDELWRTDVDGDIVSFHAHPKWIACLVAGEQATVQIWLPDGVQRASVSFDSNETYDTAWWPPLASRWPAIVGGDDEHVVIVENRSGSAYVSCIRIGHVEPAWQTVIPFRLVDAPYGWLRKTNRASLAFIGDAAVARSGRKLQGLLH